MAALAYAMMTRPARGIAPFFIDALPEGGNNVVNVMLVAVPSTPWAKSPCWASWLTVYALLRRFRPARITLPPQQRAIASDLVAT